jgi:hypothetical protein
MHSQSWGVRGAKPAFDGNSLEPVDRVALKRRENCVGVADTDSDNKRIPILALKCDELYLGARLASATPREISSQLSL